MKFTLLYTLLFITILAGIAYAAPDEVFIHGVLRNATTNNLTDTIQNVNLKVYNAAQANVYDTTQNNVHIDDGIYHIVYGALSHTWFLGNYSFIITIGADSYSQTEFVPTPVAHAAYWANDSDLLDGQSGAYYLDDTDTFNTTADIQAVAVGGEVSGTVGAITLDNNALDDQYYELADKVGNSTVEIQAVCYDTPAEIYTAAPHTNRTDADILSLYYAQTDRYTVTNFTVDHTAASHAYVGNCSGANCDIGFGNITGIPDFYTGTTINETINTTIDDKLSGVLWYFYTNYTTYGTVVANSNLSKTRGSYDKDSLNITEVVTNGLEYYANTSNNVTTSVNQICIRYMANGDNYNLYLREGTDWESYGVMGEVSTFTWHCESIRDPTDHVIDNKIIIKIEDSGLGKTAHYLKLENMYVSSGYSVLSTTEVDPIWVGDKSDYYTSAQVNTTYFSYSDRYTPINFSSNLNTAISFQDFYNGTQINASCDARDADTWNSTAEIYAAAPHTNRTDTDIRGLFGSSSNISYSSATGVFYFNLSCEAITGDAGLCDGSDDTSSSDPSQWDIINQTMLDNSTIVRYHNTTWIDNTYFAYTDRFTNSNFTTLYFAQTDRYTVTNFTTNHAAGSHAYIGNCSGADCTIGFGNITGLPDYYTGLQINASCDARDTDTDTNTWNSTADIYAAAPHTNRTDAEILNLYYTQTDRYTVTNFTTNYYTPTDRYTVTNFTTNYFAQTDRYTPTNFSVNLNTALISLDIYNGTQINATQSNYIINDTDVRIKIINLTGNLTMNNMGIWHNGSGWCIGGC